MSTADPADGYDVQLRAALEPLPPALTVLALGGYGRREMAPFSDVDLQFLTSEGPSDEVLAAIQRCLHALWSAGAKVGYATRTAVETVELANADFKTAMALLDARVVAGDRGDAEDLVASLHERVFRPRATELLRAIVDERAERHGRLADSVFLLEPDIKLGQGGLRDVHGARFAARLRSLSPSDPVSFAGLGITPEEADALEGAHRELGRIRTALHGVAGRRGDRLFFAHQEAVADAMGVSDVAAAMQRFWRSAARIRALTGRVLDHLVVEMGGTIGPWLSAHEGVEPETAVALFRRSGELGLRLHPATSKAIAAALPRVNEATREDPAVIEDFFAVLTSADDGRALAEMHDIGLLGAILPEFRSVTGRYQRNVLHLYTVDVHSLNGINELKRLRRQGPDSVEPEAVLLSSLDEVDRRVLFLSLLLHDIDKAGLDPALAGGVAIRLGLGDANAALVEQLVRGHLTLALLAQTRDVHEASTQRQLAREVGDRRTLALLFLLTHGDMASTNPEFYTHWKRGLLRELFQRTDAYFLTQGLGVFADAAHVARSRRRQVFALLGARADHPDKETRDLDGFLAQLPTRYFVVTPAEVVAQHVKMRSELGARSQAPRVARRSSDTLQWFTVVCPDAPGLLYRLSGVFAARGLSLLRVEAFHTADGIAIIDVAVAQEPRDAAAVEAELVAVAVGGEAHEPRLRERERPSVLESGSPRPAVEVSVDPAASTHFTVVDVVAPDRAGLLYKAARALHQFGVTLELACVTIEGNLARQAFYVVEDGRKLSADRAAGLVEFVRDAVAAPV